MADRDIVHDVRKIYEHIENIAEYEPKKQQLDQKLKKALEEVEMNPKGFDSLTEEADVYRNGETVLHFAIRKLSFDRKGAGGKKVIELIVKLFEKLRYESRQQSVEFRGQTPLHLAVTKGTNKILKLLLDPNDTEKKLLQKRADGRAFKKTVMMAELPLSVAALKNDQKMFKKLYRKGAKLDGDNSYGDNVCHSLIRYAFLYPDKLKSHVMKMLQYINEGTYISSKQQTCPESGPSAYWENPINKIWVMKNNEGLSPLQLAAKFGQHEIFKFIMDREGYCSQNDSDGLFDVKVYDITEIDAISFEDPDVLEDKKDDGVENASKQDAHSTVVSKNISILRRLLELDPGCAIEFITFPPVWRTIDAKWKAYQKYFWPWFIFHVLFMSYLSWYSTFRSLQNTNVDGGFNVTLQPVFTNPLLDQPLSLAFGILNILAGAVILFDAIVRRCLKRMPLLKLSSLLNPYSNATFRFLFILFGLSLIGDFILAAAPLPKYENYLLMLAVFIGWLLVLFFLRAVRAFSYFTVMIQYVLTGDLFRFAVVIMCELIGFTTVMYMALQGASEVDSEYSNYWRVLLSMFKLMVGLGDVGLLYQTRHPFLTIIILIGFIILTTLLMINSLIAMISRTSEDHGMGAARNIYWRLQRLSLVLYIESVLPKTLIYLCGNKRKTFWYNNRQKGKSKMYRYSLEIKSLLDADNNENTEEETSMTNVLHVLQHLKTEKISPGDITTLENAQPHSNGLEASLTSSSTNSLGTSTMKSLPTMEIYHHDLCTDCSKISEVKSYNVTNY